MLECRFMSRSRFKVIILLENLVFDTHLNFIYLQ